MDTDSAYMAVSGDSFEELIKPELRKEFDNDKTTGSSLHSRPKENALPDFSKSSLKATKSLVFVANRIAQKNLHRNHLQVKSSSL